MDLPNVQFTRIMNFLLDKTEHQEMPHQQLNSQGNLLQTQAVHAAVIENQPMWRCQMSTVLQQTSPNSSQTVCMTQGCNVTECFSGVEHSRNDVTNSLSVGLREPGNLNNTRGAVPQTSSEDREPHSPSAEVSRRKQKLPNYKRNGTWCKKQTYRAPETGASNQVNHDEIPRVKRSRGPKPKIMYDGNGPMQLWQFILSLLVSSPSEGVVEWTRERKYEFRILEPDKLAMLWGELKKKPAMTFLKLARGLRYYYGKSVLEKVRGKQYTYEFVMDISAILGYDPVPCENAESAGSSVNPANVVFSPSEDLQSDELRVLDSARHKEECRGNGEGLLSIGAGSSGIKLFDFSVLVESNETSSFYEAL